MKLTDMTEGRENIERMMRLYDAQSPGLPGEKLNERLRRFACRTAGILQSRDEPVDMTIVLTRPQRPTPKAARATREQPHINGWKMITGARKIWQTRADGSFGGPILNHDIFEHTGVILSTKGNAFSYVQLARVAGGMIDATWADGGTTNGYEQTRAVPLVVEDLSAFIVARGIEAAAFSDI